MKIDKIIKNIENRYHKGIAITKTNDDLKIIGITGSNGKSSTSYIIHQYLKKTGHKSALYSSILIDSPLSNYKNFTAVENPLYDEEMILDAVSSSINAGCEYLILEVNERSILKGLVDNIDFDIRVLTNIKSKQNQLYDNYVELKKQFIKSKDSSVKIVVVTDDDTASIVNEDNNIKVVTTEYLKKLKLNNREKVDYLLSSVDKYYCTIEGLNFKLKDINKNNLIKIKSKMFYPFHGLNIACAFSVLSELDIDLKDFSSFIKNIEIPGRDEVIKYKTNKIIVSPNLSPHLEILKEFKNSKQINNIYLVTGSTGYGFVTWDKDFETNKYKEIHEYDMKFAYRYASKYADKIFITTTDIADNNMLDFLEYQKSLVCDNTKCIVINDRKKAIEKAINCLQEKDILLVSGRGNREFMCISKNKICRFQDKKEIMNIIKGGYYE